jgi:hypothetical protein
MGYDLVSTTRWVGMSGNMRVYVILEINGYQPCVVGIECSATLKIVTNPLFQNYSYIWKIYVFCKGIYEMKPYMCRKIALCK